MCCHPSHWLIFFKMARLHHQADKTLGPWDEKFFKSPAETPEISLGDVSLGFWPASSPMFTRLNMFQSQTPWKNELQAADRWQSDSVWMENHSATYWFIYLVLLQQLCTTIVHKMWLFILPAL